MSIKTKYKGHKSKRYNIKKTGKYYYNRNKYRYKNPGLINLRKSDVDDFMYEIRSKREMILQPEEKETIKKTHPDYLKNEKIKKTDNDALITITTGYLTPPYDQLTLYLMADYSTILEQCVDSYKTNVTGFGLGYQYKYDYDTMRQKNKNLTEDADREVEEFLRFFDNSNDRNSFLKVLAMVIGDKEKTGNGYMGVIRDTNNKPIEVFHIPSWTVFIVPPDKDIIFEKKIITEDGKIIKRIKRKKFYRYVQVLNTLRYFKEFGDPRVMNAETGEYVAKGSIPESEEACEIIHFKIERSDTIYGVPRWIGETIAISGSRRAEEVNYTYFDNGRITSMAVMVSGGQLTKESYDALLDIKGSSNAFNWLILEALGSDDIYDKNKTNLELKNLTEIIQQDALFQNYDQNNRNKVRSAFRLPPIYTGESQDYTRATASTAQRIAETQVFEPYRKDIADIINKTLIEALGFRKIKFKLYGPPVADQKEFADTLKVYSDMGAVTPNIARKPLEELLSTVLENYDEWWGDIPVILASIIGNSGNNNISSDLNKNTGKNSEKSAETIKSLIELRQKILKELQK